MSEQAWGGLTLARVLHIKGIKSTIYEAEESPDIRYQGGLLDIHAHNGQLGLKTAGLYEAFRELILPSEDAKRIVDKHAMILLDKPSSSNTPSPEVSRGELRKLLINSLPKSTIKWGHKVTRITQLASGRYQLEFTNGGLAISELLVGADGGWSKVRPLLSRSKPSYIGTTFIETNLTNTNNRYQACADIIGNGTLIAVEQGRGLLAHRYADGTLRTYVALNKPETWIDKIDFNSLQTGLKRIAEEFVDWAPQLRELITGYDNVPVVRKLFSLPIEHKWERIPGVTLLGDAAHLMSPFAGEGANLAIYDGAELGSAITAYLSNMELALGEYERALFVRSKAAADQTYRNHQRFFGAHSPHSVVELFR